tara:strand:- start:8095 stop:8898 length:804 start_codon:yes stop_codon:yes gene_type:complete
VQIVGFESGLEGIEYDLVEGTSSEPEAPHLIIANRGELERIRLNRGETIRYKLLERSCAGEIENGKHQACGERKAPYCTTHINDWLCARCTGNCDLPLPTCKQVHAVYIAGFPPSTFKVGVTRMSRLITRLKEQGARKAAHIETVSNGRTARQIERGIADKIKDRVISKEKINGIGQYVNEEEWEKIIENYKTVKTFDLEYGFELEYPPIPTVMLSGEIVGVEGRFLVLKVSNDNYAVDLRDLIGYEIEQDKGSGEMSLQASLGMLK